MPQHDGPILIGAPDWILLSTLIIIIKEGWILKGSIFTIHVCLNHVLTMLSHNMLSHNL